MVFHSLTMWFPFPCFPQQTFVGSYSLHHLQLIQGTYVVGTLFIGSRRNSLSQQLSSVTASDQLWRKLFCAWKLVDHWPGNYISDRAECGCNCPDHYNPLKGLCSLSACCQPGVAISERLSEPQVQSVAVVWFPALGVCAWRGRYCTVIMPELLIFMWIPLASQL